MAYVHSVNAGYTLSIVPSKQWQVGGLPASNMNITDLEIAYSPQGYACVAYSVVPLTVPLAECFSPLNVLNNLLMPIVPSFQFDFAFSPLHDVGCVSLVYDSGYSYRCASMNATFSPLPSNPDFPFQFPRDSILHSSFAGPQDRFFCSVVVESSGAILHAACSDIYSPSVALLQFLRNETYEVLEIFSVRSGNRVRPVLSRLALFPSSIAVMCRAPLIGQRLLPDFMCTGF